MEFIKERLAEMPWDRVVADLHEKGYAVLKHVISKEVCADLIADYSNVNLYRKVITMERYRFGKGEYKYFQYPLPGLIQEIREIVYPYLAPVANAWMKALTIETVYPETLQALQRLCEVKQQTQPTVLILKYGEGGFNTLHQDLYGEVFFPMQLVLFLNEPGEDYEGGEFVLTEQIPRAQSKAIVLKPGKGDMLIFTTNFRPAKGNKGYYRVQMKHGVSEVQRGERHTLGIIFHDALT